MGVSSAEGLRADEMGMEVVQSLISHACFCFLFGIGSRVFSDFTKVTSPHYYCVLFTD